MCFMFKMWQLSNLDLCSETDVDGDDIVSEVRDADPVIPPLKMGEKRVQSRTASGI